MQRTLVLIKPDGVRKGLKGSEIIANSDLTIIDSKELTPSIELARCHYNEHVGKSFFDRITTALTVGPVSAIIIEGPNAIQRVRDIIGSRDDISTIRGKYSNPEIQHENAIHGSDSVNAATSEIALWFN